jgi:hypothetical protein
MPRNRIDVTTEYAVTRVGYCIGGDVEKTRIMARRAGRLRSDIWNKYGSLQCWGISHQKLYKEFQKTNPPSMYRLDQKQWQKTFESRKVLIKRTVSFLLQRDLTLDDAINLGWFDPLHLKGIDKEARVESEPLVA